MTNPNEDQSADDIKSADEVHEENGFDSTDDALFAQLMGFASDSKLGPAPVEVRSDLRLASTSMYELYVAWVEAGFSKAEAMQLVTALLLSGLK